MLAVVVHGFRGAAIRRQPEQAVVQEIESAVVCAAEAPGRLDHLVEDGLQSRRTGDRAENAADGALLLAEFLELTFEARLVSAHRGHRGNLRGAATVESRLSLYGGGDREHAVPVAVRMRMS